MCHKRMVIVKRSKESEIYSWGGGEGGQWPGPHSPVGRGRNFVTK